MPNAKQLEIKSHLILSSLKQSVAKALHKKKCLGQYAVISEHGKIIKLCYKSGKESEKNRNID